MFNKTQIIYFNKLVWFLTFKTISKDFYCFNEDTFNVENFYFKNWESFGNQSNSSVLVGVVIQGSRQLVADFNKNLWQTAAAMKNIRLVSYELSFDITNLITFRY